MPERIVKTYDATGRELHVDVPMSNLIINYRTQGLLGETLFPVVTVDRQSNMIPYIPLGEFLRSEAALRAPGAQARIVAFNVGSMSYFCKNYALKAALTVEDRENADRVWNLRENKAYQITDLINIGKEIRCCNAINSSTNVNTVFTVTSAWNGTTTNNPITDIDKMLYNVQDTTGFKPNLLVFGQSAWRSFRVHSAVRALLFPHGGGIPSVDQARGMFDVDRVFVAQGYYNTNAEGFSASLSPFLSDAVYGFYQPGGGAIGPLPRYAATFRWQLAGVPSMTVEVHPYDSRTKSEEIEIGVYDDERVLDARLGVCIKGVHSSQ